MSIDRSCSRTAGCPRRRRAPSPGRSAWSAACPRRFSTIDRDVGVRERPEHDPRLVRSVGPGGLLLEQLAPGRAEDHHRGVLDRSRPGDRSAPGTSPRPSGCRRTRPRSAAPRRAPRGTAGCPRTARPPGTARRPARCAAPTRSAISSSRHQGTQLLARLLGGIRLADPGRAPDDLDDRPERDAVAVGQAAAADDPRAGRPPSPRTPGSAGSCRRQRRRSTSPCGTAGAPTTLSKAPERTAISASRPTIGASRRASARPAERVASRRYARTGCALPFSVSGSTSSTSTRSRTRL